MSFSKARIQRFNEVGNEVPPPGSYDPKFDSKIKGLVIEKTERFYDTKSVCSAGAECNSVAARSIGGSPTTAFRTPQLVRKRVIVKPTNLSCPKAKTKLAISSKTRKMQYDSQHELADLQVECANKDKTIKEHERHIDDMKEEVRMLEQELEELRAKQARVDDQHKRDMETMAKLQQEILNDHDEKHQAEESQLRSQLLQVTAEKDREILARAAMETELKDRIAELSERITTLETELTAMEANESKVQSIQAERDKVAAEFKKLQEDHNGKINLLEEEKSQVTHRLQTELESANVRHCNALKEHREYVDALKKLHEEETTELKRSLEEAKEEHRKQIENLTIERNKKLEGFKEASTRKIEEETKRMRELVENAEAVTRETLAACRAECEERVKRVISENDDKVNKMIAEARAAVEEEMRITAERYKACLARVEAERVALDEKLAQRDAEITRLSETLEELRSSAETQESFSQSLQVELDRAETELAEKKEELRALKDQIRAEAAEMVARRKRFEVIMTENQASVAALTRRLVQSNAEVERLQHELKRGDDCIHEHRNLLTAMRNNSQLVHEHVYALMEQLDAKRELVDQLEAGSLNEIKSIKAIFEAKIDSLNQLTSKEVTKLQEECQMKTNQNAELNKQLAEMYTRLRDAQNMLLTLEVRVDAQSVEITRMELLNDKLEAQSRRDRKALEESNELRETESKQHKVVVDEANSRIEELSEKIKSLQGKQRRTDDKAPSVEHERETWKNLERALLNKLDQERTWREAAEDETKKLTTEYQEVSEKYAQLLGHQNHKQRIRHVSQLKDKINRMEQELQAKNAQIKQQQKTIEKLKVDETSWVHGKGKENVLAVPKSNYTTPTSSPHKPLTPLRDRND